MKKIVILSVVAFTVSSCYLDVADLKEVADATQTPIVCPTDFIKISKNPAVGTTKDFCVMKYEAKDDGSGNAISQAATTPYVNIQFAQASTLCQAMGTGYDLISNAEWMTIARDLENVSTNWDSGVVGTGALFRGHTDMNPNARLEVTNTADPYDGTGNNSSEAMGSGKEQQRTLVLSSGDEIWDFAGNVWEWVDWSASTAGADYGPTTCSAWTPEFVNINCADLASASYIPGNPGNISPLTNYTSTYGIGQYVAGTGGAAYRGGSRQSSTQGGIYALALNNNGWGNSQHIGFRCVYRQ